MKKNGGRLKAEGWMADFERDLFVHLQGHLCRFFKPWVDGSSPSAQFDLGKRDLPDKTGRDKR